MARTVPQHKAQYAQFIAPGYREDVLVKVDEEATAGEFQRFSDACFAQLPDEGKPADPYLYSSHAGAFVRALDQAKDHWVKAKLSFYGERTLPSVTS
jgi:hypothetical protein